MLFINFATSFALITEAYLDLYYLADVSNYLQKKTNKNTRKPRKKAAANWFPTSSVLDKSD